MESESLTLRVPWRDFPAVGLQTNGNTLKSHQDYQAAKAGDAPAALRTVSAIYKPHKVHFDCDCIVAVFQLDQARRNALPYTYAKFLGKELGVPAVSTVFQINQVSHTGAGAETRILGQPLYAGKIEPRQKVLIVDDVVTFGSTLANLRGWLEQHGCQVVGATTLAQGMFGAQLSPPERALEKLQEKFGDRVGDLARNLGFAPECFTKREIFQIAKLSQKKFDALVLASEKNHARLFPVAEYDQEMQILLDAGISKHDARQRLEQTKPDLVGARDSRVQILRFATVQAELNQRQSHTHRRSH